MDLGLNQLSDDQLLELVQQACQELVVRDPYVRRIAQETIFSQAEVLKCKKEALKAAVQQAGHEYVLAIQNEVAIELREGVRRGTVRLLSPAQEAKAAGDAEFAAKIQVIDETMKAIQGGKLKADSVPDAGPIPHGGPLPLWPTPRASRKAAS